MELVPPNRKKWLSTLVPRKTQKITEFLQNKKNSPDLSVADFWLHGYLKVVLIEYLFCKKTVIQAQIYSPMPNNLNELLQHAEDVIDNINNHKQAMVVRSVLKMKDKARACVAVGGGHFEGRKVQSSVSIAAVSCVYE